MLAKPQRLLTVALSIDQCNSMETRYIQDAKMSVISSTNGPVLKRRKDTLDVFSWGQSKIKDKQRHWNVYMILSAETNVQATANAHHPAAVSVACNNINHQPPEFIVALVFSVSLHLRSKVCRLLVKESGRSAVAHQALPPCIDYVLSESCILTPSSAPQPLSRSVFRQSSQWLSLHAPTRATLFFLPAMHAHYNCTVFERGRSKRKYTHACRCPVTCQAERDSSLDLAILTTPNALSVMIRESWSLCFPNVNPYTKMENLVPLLAPAVACRNRSPNGPSQVTAGTNGAC